MPAVDVFLSYHGPDRAAAARLRDQLLALGLRVFMDRTHLAPGLPFPEALERGLQACAAVVVLVGGKIGDWQKREIFVALERQDEEARAARAFPVLLPGADIRAAFLFANTWVDLREASNDAAPFEQLIGAIRNASVAAGTRAAVTDVCPFRGLDAFREEDAAFFHGRGAVVARLTKRVHERRLVAVVGSSGSGKSSLVMAGLLPALRRRRPPAPTWDAVVFKPGSDPCVSLVRALMHWQEPEADSFSRAQRADAHGRQLASGTTRFTTLLDELLPASGAERLLLVVDQFEELFTLTKDETQRTAFVQILLEAVEGGRVTPVLTLRSEFYPHAINVDPSGALATLIEDGVLNALTPDREQLGEAIARPAHLLGLTFRPPALVERMLNEVGSAPGRLPLLEYALQELWNRRDGTELTETAYDGIGGVARAIAQRADSEFEKLNATDREHARRVMVRLVRTTQSSEGLENTRERLDLASLHADARRVVQRFVDVRLLVTWRTVHVPAVLATPADGSQTAPPTVGEAVDTVEVAHEALIGAWGKLTEWLKADQDLRLWRQKLAPYVADWKQDSSNVLGKTLLAEARAQLAAQRGDLLDDEIACIEASAARW